MKQLLDFFSLLTFFIVYKLYDIYIASAVVIIVTIINFIINWIVYRKVEKLDFIMFIIITLFSTLTLVFHNDCFIKLKVTIIYLMLSIVLLYSQHYMKKSMIETMFYKSFTLSNVVWRRLNFSWALFFLICSILNFYIAFHFSQKIWIYFKVFGITGLTLVFTCYTAIYISKQLNKK